MKLFNKGKPSKPLDNVITITKEGIEYSYKEHLDTIPMICRNNGREYEVISNDKRLDVPDHTEYYDPGEYGNVLTMPGHRKLFEKRGNLFQQLAPFALVGAMVVIAILYIVTTG